MRLHLIRKGTTPRSEQSIRPDAAIQLAQADAEDEARPLDDSIDPADGAPAETIQTEPLEALDNDSSSDSADVDVADGPEEDNSGGGGLMSLVGGLGSWLRSPTY